VSTILEHSRRWNCHNASRLEETAAFRLSACAYFAMPLFHGSLTKYQDGSNRPYQAVFKSRSVQRPALCIDPERGPGMYSPKPGYGIPKEAAAIFDPLRQGSAFASKSKKAEIRPSTAANVPFAPDEALQLRHLPRAPGTHSAPWAKGERKPPFFHVPFKPYPLENGAPIGRSPGLDQFYELDHIGASPVALFGTMTVNMSRSPRRYSVMKTKTKVVRGQPMYKSGAGNLGPGQYNIPRNGIDLKDPLRPSSAFARIGKGKFEGVGGSYAEWMGIEVKPPKPPWE